MAGKRNSQAPLRACKKHTSAMMLKTLMIYIFLAVCHPSFLGSRQCRYYTGNRLQPPVSSVIPRGQLTQTFQMPVAPSWWRLTKPGNELMTADVRTTEGAAKALAEKLTPLVLELLARLRRFRDTPLLEDLDSAGIAQDCWNSFLSNLPRQEQGAFQDWQATLAALDCLIESALPETLNPAGQLPGQLPTPEPDASNGPGASVAGPGCKHPPSLAAWLEGVHQSLGEVHSKSFELLGLRLEGYAPRDLAQKFNLGLRQIQRVLGDLRQAWKRRGR